MSRSSVCETIQEEAPVYSSSHSPRHPIPQYVAKQMASSLMNDMSIIVVESDRDSVCSVEWDGEHGLCTSGRGTSKRNARERTHPSRCSRC